MAVRQGRRRGQGVIFLFWLLIRAFARVQEEQETGPQSWRSSALRLWASSRKNTQRKSVA